MKVFVTIFLCLQLANRGTCKLSDQMEDTTQHLMDLLYLIKEMPYKSTLSWHCDNIKSCANDFTYLLANPKSTAARSNFLECYKIIGDVRAIGRYLSGKATFGPYPFFEIYEYHKIDEYSKGQALETIFQYLYSNFIDGCNLVVATERMMFNHNSTLYRDECLNTVRDINSYMTDLYRKANVPLIVIDSSFQGDQIVKEPKIQNVSATHKN